MNTNNDDMRPEYRREELGAGVRGKYYAEYQRGTNLVLLSPDVAKVFSTEESVNAALRSLMDIARKTTVRSKRPRTKPADRCQSTP